MRTLLALTVVMFLTAPMLFAGDAKDDAKSDREKLNGKWTVTALTVDGQEVPSSMFESVPWDWVIDKDKIISKRPGSQGVIHDEELKFDEMDASKTPKSVEMVDVARNEKSHGIYDLDGDSFKICFSMDHPGERPTEFESKSGSKRVFIKIKRQK